MLILPVVGRVKLWSIHSEVIHLTHTHTHTHYTYTHSYTHTLLYTHTHTHTHTHTLSLTHTHTDSITISHVQPLQEWIVAPNTWARYTCKISGVPPPTIKWTFNGVEISENSSIHIENNTTTLRDKVTVTSTLFYLSSHESGQVACIGYHMEGERLAMVTSEAHLIVLSKGQGSM